VSGTRTGVSATTKRGRRWWLLAVEIATVVGVLIGAAALLLDHSPFGSSGGGSTAAASGNATTPAPTAPSPSSPSPSGPPTPSGPASAQAAQRYLTDLVPDSGGGNVQRIGPRSLRMACGSGDSDDRFREVSYLVPPAEHYRSFGTVVAAAGARGTRIQAILMFDGLSATEPVTIAAGGSQPLRAGGHQVQRLTLRIVCDPGATAATFSDPGLSA
jgi:hypothetical protein